MPEKKKIKVKVKKRRLKVKKILVTILIMGILVLSFLYIKRLPITNIYIVGNNILSDKEIIDISGIGNYPSFITTLGSNIKDKLMENNYIKEIKVQKKVWGKVYTYVTEKKVLALYNDKLLLEDGLLVDNNYNVMSAPILIGDITSIKEKFIKKFSLVDNDVLLKISEISYVPNEVDSERFSLKMNDGNLVYITLPKITKINKYNNYLQKIIKGTPIQYITKHQQFMALDFYVDENVLIPQPDTEVLVEEGIKIIKEQNMEVLDLCTGSGAIAISIAHYCQNSTVTATDISQEALEVARKNANLNNVNIEFIESNLFDKLTERSFDIILSNPPYIETDIIKTLEKDVQAEPHLALDGGKDGLEFYKKILNEAHKHLKTKGYLMLEIGYNQGNAVINLEHKNLKLITKQPIKDLAGNDRIVTFQKEG